MKEQIEEMARIAQRGIDEQTDRCPYPDCQHKHSDVSCDACEATNALYNAGYRKQKEGEWIWTENGEEDYEQYWVCSCCHEKSYWESKFCSDCGAKMKGGAE